MENAEEFLYRAFCTALFCLALSLLFLLVKRQFSLLEKAEEALRGSNRQEAILFEGQKSAEKAVEQSGQITGGQLLLQLYDPLPVTFEIDGIILKAGELYGQTDFIRPDSRYEKELIYAEGKLDRIVFQKVS